LREGDVERAGARRRGRPRSVMVVAVSGVRAQRGKQARRFARRRRWL
jgi:hypothetical protein